MVGERVTEEPWRGGRVAAEPRRAAVLGSPVRHSLSPVLHTAGYSAAGLAGQWTYDRREVVADELAGVVAGLDPSWRGLSLTMPLKEAALEVAATVSPTARAAGAANTLVRRADGGWDADNTDIHGIEAALAGAEHDGAGLVLGSGATARSAVLALRGLGVERVTVAARNPATSAAIVDWAARLAEPVTVLAAPLDGWVRHAARVVVSSLPPTGGSAAADHLTRGTWRLDGATLLDVVYADWPTPLARAATARGARVVSGIEMLVHQAARQFELFTGVVPAPVAAMLAAGRAALG